MPLKLGVTDISILYTVFPQGELLGLTRSQIDFEGALEGKDLEIAYTDDFLRLFFLHVQGSGVLKLEDGSEIYVGYAGKNKHEYSSIGKYFLDNKLIPRDEISMQSIISYLENNPQEPHKILSLNDSYIFFKEKTQPATGSFGLPLFPEASIAIDKEFYPLGIPALIDFEVGGSIDESAHQQLVFMHDTGSAIKTAIRADLFLGRGKLAEGLAGRAKSTA
jgi:membrane-bound lytic murein transglycosylase A